MRTKKELMSHHALSFAIRLVNFFFTLSLFIIGNLSSFTQDLAKTASNVVLKGFFTIIHLIVPYF